MSGPNILPMVQRQVQRQVQISTSGSTSGSNFTNIGCVYSSDRTGLFFFLDEVQKLSSIYCGFKGHTVHIGGA